MSALSALGVGAIVVGAALVCAGIIFWPESPRDDLTGHDDGPNELRPIIDALEEEDRRARNPQRVKGPHS